MDDFVFFSVFSSDFQKWREPRVLFPMPFAYVVRMAFVDRAAIPCLRANRADPCSIPATRSIDQKATRSDPCRDAAVV